MRLWWTSWDYSPLDFSQANCGENARTNYRIKEFEDLRTLMCHHMGRIIYRKTQQWPQNFSIGGKLDWKRILGGLCLRNHTFTDIIFLVGMAPIPLHQFKACYFSNNDLSLSCYIMLSYYAWINSLFFSYFLVRGNSVLGVYVCLEKNITFQVFLTK